MSATITATRFFVVFGHRDDAALQAYLYGTASLVKTAESVSGRNVAVVQVAVSGEVGAEQSASEVLDCLQDRVAYVANYQADRIASGGYGVASVADEFPEDDLVLALGR